MFSLEYSDNNFLLNNEITHDWNTQDGPGYACSDETKLYGKVIGFTNEDALKIRYDEAVENEKYEDAARIKEELNN